MNGILKEAVIVRCCAFFSSWCGLANPPSSAEVFDLVRRDEAFLLSRRHKCEWTPIPTEKVCGLLSALFQSKPDGAASESIMTDDYPQFRLRVVLTDGDVLVADSSSQLPGMVPWRIRRRSDATDLTSNSAELGPAISAILPEGAVNRGRLAYIAVDKIARLKNRLANMTGSESEASGSARSRRQRNDLDESLFHVGWERDPVQSLTTLLSQGADVNAQDHLDRTALVIACRFGKHILVQPLLDAGADANIFDNSGATALYYACRNAKVPEDLVIVKQLISAGASVASCLELAVKSSSGVSLLLTDLILDAGGNVEEVDAVGMTGLMRSVSSHNHDLIANWIRIGADVNARTPSGKTVLMQALLSPETVEALIKSGADVNAIDLEGRTALIRASQSRSAPPQVVEILLSAGADPSIRDMKDLSALDYATEIEYLISMKDEVMAEFATSGFDERPPHSRKEPTDNRARRIRELLLS